MKICPKCGYQRTKGDDIHPDYECPKCGVIYEKAKIAYEKAQMQKQVETAESQKKEDRILAKEKKMDEILRRILYEGETVISTVKTMDNVPFKKAVTEDYKDTALHLALTNLSVILFSESSENTYYERYMLDEIWKVSGWNELWVYHFYITTKDGRKRKLNFKGDSKEILRTTIVPRIENFIGGTISQKELDDFYTMKPKPLIEKPSSEYSENTICKLIECPDCGKDVSRRATLCPNCGCPLSAIISNESSSEKRYHNKNYLNDEHEYAVRGTKMTPKKWIIFFIAATLVIIIGSLYQKHYGGSDTKESKTGDVNGAWAYMQLFVEKRLKSPQSADFPFGGYRHVAELGAGRYKVNSYVDSQNSFGANIRTHFEGVIKKTDGGWELEYLNFK